MATEVSLNDDVVKLCPFLEKPTPVNCFYCLSRMCEKSENFFDENYIEGLLKACSVCNRKDDVAYVIFEPVDRVYYNNGQIKTEDNFFCYQCEIGFSDED